MSGGSGRRALVTGGAGFIGSHLVEALVDDGWRVRVLDDFSSGCEQNLEARRGCIEVLRGDVRDEAAVREAVDGADAVFHQAARVSVPRSRADPLESHAVNATGTLGVLEAARAAGVRRVVFASSCAVYGDRHRPPLAEDLWPDPRSPYAVQKWIGETYCRLYTEQRGLETVALRYFNVFGPRQDADGAYAAVIPRFGEACLRGAAPRVVGDGEQTRDFVFVADVVRANQLAADAPGASGRCLNVATGRATSVLELLEQIRALTGARAQAIHEPARPGDVRHSAGDLLRAEEVLGFRPTHTLRQGLERLLMETGRGRAA